MKNEIEITIPTKFMNIFITKDNHIVADTNNSADWLVMRFPLPEGEWKRKCRTGDKIILVLSDEYKKELRKNKIKKCMNI